MLPSFPGTRVHILLPHRHYSTHSSSLRNHPLHGHRQGPYSSLTGIEVFTFLPLDSLSSLPRRMASCGRGSVRLWRLRGGVLRSCPVDLGEYHALDFTDLDFAKAQDHTL